MQIKPPDSKRTPPEERIESAVAKLRAAKTKGELAEAISSEVRKYSIYELQVIGGLVRREVDKLPNPYRDKVRPYFQQQLFDIYNRLMSMQRSGKFSGMMGKVKDPSLFNEYLDMIPGGCFNDPETSGTDFNFEDPVKALFYYLLSCFTMFVLDESGHPEGTPFPGGFSVERRGNEYYCPIRDKEEGVPFSICNFCPAKQMEGV
ncbi:MAG: DUF2115 domain-containing protein [Methanomicrobiaceae archaeon]|nr:DUF2115 domain-containing protein [Methanomicrobiaceae archaeon]